MKTHHHATILWLKKLHFSGVCMWSSAIIRETLVEPGWGRYGLEFLISSRGPKALKAPQQEKKDLLQSPWIFISVYVFMYDMFIYRNISGFLGTTAVFHESLRAGPVHPWKFQNLFKHGSFLSNIFPKTGWTHQGHFFGPGGLGGNGYERYHLGEWREFGATLDPRTEGISLLSDDSTHVLFSAMGGERKQMKTVMFQKSDWMN